MILHISTMIIGRKSASVKKEKRQREGSNGVWIA